MSYNNNNHVPRFMDCASYEEPELNYILHTQYPKFMVEVADSYDEDDVIIARQENLFFKEVLLHNGDKDLLVIVDFYDKVDITDNKTFDLIYDVLNEMALFHTEEIKDLEKYAH